MRPLRRNQRAFSSDAYPTNQHRNVCEAGQALEHTKEPGLEPKASMGHCTLRPTPSILPPFTSCSSSHSLSNSSPCLPIFPPLAGPGKSLTVMGRRCPRVPCHRLSSFLALYHTPSPVPSPLRVRSQASRGFPVPSHGARTRSEFRGQELS